MNRTRQFRNIAVRWTLLILLVGIPLRTYLNNNTTPNQKGEFTIRTLTYPELRHWFQPDYHYYSDGRYQRMQITNGTIPYNEYSKYSEDISDARVDHWFVWHFRNWLPFEIRITNQYMLSRWLDIPGIIFMLWTVLLFAYFFPVNEDPVAPLDVQQPQGGADPYRENAKLNVEKPPVSKSFHWIIRAYGYTFPLGLCLAVFFWMMSHPVVGCLLGALVAFCGTLIVFPCFAYLGYCAITQTWAATMQANLLIAWFIGTVSIVIFFGSLVLCIILHEAHGGAERLTQRWIRFGYRIISFAAGH